MSLSRDCIYFVSKSTIVNLHFANAQFKSLFCNYTLFFFLHFHLPSFHFFINVQLHIIFLIAKQLVINLLSEDSARKSLSLSLSRNCSAISKKCGYAPAVTRSRNCNKAKNIITPADVYAYIHTYVRTYVKLALAIQRGAQLYRCNNFNPLLFAAVNDSFPLKFTNGHKRRVAPTAQSARFVPPSPLPLSLCPPPLSPPPLFFLCNPRVKHDFQECRER